MKTENEFENQNKTKTNRPGMKLLIIAAICVGLLIPQALIRNLIDERYYTANEASNDVYQKWSGQQEICGPIIKVPWRAKDANGAFTGTTFDVYLLPENLNIKGNVNTKTLNRGIFDCIVYDSPLEITGSFTLPKEFDSTLINNILYHQTRLIIGIEDLRGLTDNISMTYGSEQLEMESGTYTSKLNGVSCKIDIKPLIEGEKIDFTLVLPLKGSESLSFIPIGRTTSVNLTSDCPTPSFNGNYLPIEREVNDSGFTASWKILALNRDYSQVINENLKEPLVTSSFGVDLKVPVEQYQQTTRASKYAIIIIFLTFAIVFFVEIRKDTPIHPVQYLLIGVALLVFYVLLLSFSEHCAFWFSYLIASLMTVGLISVYLFGILKIRKTAISVGAWLSVAYLLIYVLLQMENFALLVGSIIVFAVVGLCMYASQKINWYKK